MKFVFAQKKHLETIQKLAHQIWPIAYAEILSKEQLDYMLHLIYSIDSLENQMKNQVFLLLEYENQFIGFASFEQNYSNLNKTKIHKLYILPTLQGKGFGIKTIDFISDIAIKNKNLSLILNVNRFNKAKDFYQKYGFSIKEEIKIDIGNNFIMDDFIMEFILN